MQSDKQIPTSIFPKRVREYLELLEILPFSRTLEGFKSGLDDAVISDKLEHLKEIMTESEKKILNKILENKSDF